MSKQFLAILAIIIALVFGAFFFTKKDSPSSTTKTNTLQPTNHTVGAGNKSITITEYGDFECPACGAYFPIVNQIKEKYGDDIKFQFRHFPLVQIHKSAMLAHRAAEAAGNQNKFFEMHDILYQRQQAWVKNENLTEVLVQYATELQLDLAKFKQDMTSEKVNALINADIKSGQQAGATSTPTFLINDKKIENPQSVEEFYKLIDEAIKEAS